MAKKAKITLKKIAAAIGEKPSSTSTITIGTGDDAVQVTVKKSLSLTERQDMVNGIVDMTFVEDENGIAQYCAYLKKFAYEYYIITYFTDISLPADIDAIWDFLNTTDVVDQIIKEIPEKCFSEVISEANEMIEFKKSKVMKQSRLDAVLDDVISLVKTITGKLEGSDGKAILEYLEQNIPELKGELTKVFQDTAVTNAAK